MNLKIMKSQIVETSDEYGIDLIDLKFKHENGFVSNIKITRSVFVEYHIDVGDTLETFHFKNYLEGFRLPDGRAYMKDFWS